MSARVCVARNMRRCVFSVGGTDSSPEEEEEEKEVAGGFSHHSDRRDASCDARASTALRLGRRSPSGAATRSPSSTPIAASLLCVLQDKRQKWVFLFVLEDLCIQCERVRLTYLYRRYYVRVYFISYESNMIYETYK